MMISDYYYWDRISKAAPVVVVETPEAEREVRELYAGQNYMLVRAARNERTLDALGVLSGNLPMALAISGVGIAAGFVGFFNRTKPLGSILLGAGGSLLAAGIFVALVGMPAEAA